MSYANFYMISDFWEIIIISFGIHAQLKLRQTEANQN
jgi:hypothetical protein